MKAKRFYLWRGFYVIGLLLQRVVLPVVTRSVEPDVLPVRIRKQEQLQFADQPGLLRQSRPPAVLQVHRQVHCYGTFVTWFHRLLAKLQLVILRFVISYSVVLCQF